eukprot:CAMPEP_0176039650 /NCGR_PEP_ID=MMETSP0120_2-20121206/19656_1 /TAXON_ID=160619 /ORGANISM="Kryptoperidinium foliaceum, Strain CCMP 1326" /LENGTH=57 /DNA_ID=CAMNT_0017373045 /DNA_START=24 /DNA_END=195 /DNA_ORIENTATION=-
MFTTLRMGFKFAFTSSACEVLKQPAAKKTAADLNNGIDELLEATRGFNRAGAVTASV